ncbi:G-type lectin S-receptor-like serine/threonine-protein kinase B120 [Alnus glutinosa]|uniref:G-type lectin S-receptor-like serine/threonine-protein kinase B120 n=1 Tax=Alnus glutinosa TaxID=3517 RepID=UPI002D787C07|nr:G-type lectin S-receptor-like serine/threonine-protein kinase B120 [Alnus glutinosa]
MSPIISPLIASFLLLFCLALLFTNATITDSDTIRPGQSLNTSESILSANRKYKLGFFSTENSKYYVAIFYSNTTENVAVIVNREHPFPNPSAVLTFDLDGNLVISDGRLLHVLTSTSGGNNTYARLLDTGNLILTNRASGVLWQSFDYPTDNLLPGMKLKHANDHPVLRSWKSLTDPAPGSFSLHLGSGETQIILMEGSEPYWTSSLITGVLAGILVIERDYITWRNKNTNETRRIVLDLYGHLLMQTWMEGDQGWSSLKLTNCGAYPTCGVSGLCNSNADANSSCYCLPGFKRGSTFARCKRKTDSHCSDNINHVQKDWFLPVPQVYLPRNPLRLHVGKASECESACLNNCSCSGYAYDQDHLCLVWDGPLGNLKQFPAVKLYETEFYLKLAPNFTEDTTVQKNLKIIGNKQLLKFLVPTTSIVMIVTLGLFFIHYMRRKLKTKGQDLLQLDLGTTQNATNSEHEDGRKREVPMPLFNFASVSAATNNFSATNKLGEGGFGPVYKGILHMGDEVAVKRLSKRYGQGWEELKNEAVLIAKLQHKNLVRLLGCCIERDEKILVYEYMPNKSLDFFLFDQEKRKLLDWRTRVRIIGEIAQGLLYLHQYSRLRIIHRDLKPSNILLDIDMNPKISDFGMARIFGGNDSHANTNRIVGTYGYMPPEYALEGLFSIKSDVFSFGVLLLEIVSGKKNTGFYQTNSLHLIRYAWELWTSDRGSDLADPLLDNISSMQMVLRYVNIALLCVQECAADRPTMSDVVTMLSSESTIPPYPKEPAFLNVRSTANAHPINNRLEICSLNSATISIMEGR